MQGGHPVEGRTTWGEEVEERIASQPQGTIEVPVQRVKADSSRIVDRVHVRQDKVQAWCPE